MSAPDLEAIELGDDGSIWFRYRVGLSSVWPFGAKVGTNEMPTREASARANKLSIRRSNPKKGDMWRSEGGLVGRHREGRVRFIVISMP